MREFDTGATRDDDADKLDFEGHLCPLALERYAAYMHEHRKQADGKMRDSDNWQKGIPIKQCVKSMFRHFIDLWRLSRGYSADDIKDGRPISVEETCCAIIFNAFSIIHVRMQARQTPQSALLDPASGTCAPSTPVKNVIEVPTYFNIKTEKFVPSEYNTKYKTFAPQQYGDDQ